MTTGGVIAGAVKFLFWVMDEWQKRSVHQGFSAPRKTLQIAAKPEGNCWWAMGKRGDDPTMQIDRRMFVTNISSVPVRIPQAELRYGVFGRKRVSGIVMVSRARHENMYGMYDIPTNETRDLSFMFWVYPPAVEPSEPFTAHSIAFIDQFGNEHKIKRVVFLCGRPPFRPFPKNRKNSLTRLLIRSRRSCLSPEGRACSIPNVRPKRGRLGQRLHRISRLDPYRYGY